jgi:formylmethanofuran dehydrogenase subunit E
LIFISLTTLNGTAQTAEEWETWGDRLHGAFGSLIALGIRIGNDSLQRLDANRRDVTVEYTDGPKSPCACVIDGISLAVSASLGQRTLKLNEERTEEGLLARIKVTQKKTGQYIIYELPMSALPLMGAINTEFKPNQRLQAVMQIDSAKLFSTKVNN